MTNNRFGRLTGWGDTTCPICLANFKKTSPRHKYCSISCKDRGVAQSRSEAVAAKRRARMVQWNSENAQKRRNYALVRNFGITLEQYNALLENQHGGCAVCHKTIEENGKALAVDHDHHTGEIYGLLCGWCNHKVIGHLRDPEIFYRAAEYLKEGTGFFVPDKFLKGATKKKRKKKKK